MAAPEDAGSIYSDIRIRLDKLNGDISAVKTGFDKMNSNITTGSDKTTKTMTKNFDAIKLAGTGAVIAITVAFKQAIKTFADTEQQLANVRAVSNATSKEFAQLEDAAKQAGVSTRFTASEAADALFFLSSAGLSATESVKALDGVLLLAGATGSGLAESSQAITSTLSQFGLEASKAADVSNIFAAANSNSQATLDKLANSLRQVGPVAAGLDIGLEETVGSLQALFNAGFQGENAGRALKSALADLANEASPTIKKLDALGIAFETVDPTVVGLTGAIGALEEAGITTAQVIDAFGKEAGPQLATLIGAGQSALEDYTKAVTDTDEAARQYAIQNDTLKGSQDAFKSALEGTSNSLIEELTPAFRGVIDLATLLLKGINKLPSVLKGIFTGASSAAIGFGILTKALGFLGVTLGTGPLGLITLLGGVAIGLSSMVKKAQEVRQVKLAEEFGDLARELGYAGAAVDDFVQRADLIEGALVKGFGQNFEETNQQIRDISANLGISEKEIIAIGKSSKNVSDEYKSQLETIERQIIQQEDLQALLASQVTIEKAIELSKLNQQRTEARIAKEKAISEKIDQDRLDRLAQIQKEVTTLDELSSKGAISEIDLLEQKKALREEEISLLIQQSLTSGEVSASVLGDINAQQKKIDEYNARLEKLNTDEKDRQEDLKPVYKATVATYEETLNNATFAHGKFTEDSKELNEEEKLSWQETFSFISSAASNFFGALNSLSQASTNAQISEIERLRDSRLDSIDKETQALLTSLGLQDETKLESLQTQLDAAILAGETEKANQLKNEIAKTKILEEAEKKKKEIKDKATKDSNKLKREQAIKDRALASFNAVINGASAVLGFLANPGGLLGVGLSIAAGTTALAQVAAINSAPLPAFATGGIMMKQPGTKSTGDQQLARLNPKEMVLTEAQQAQLFNIANGGGNNGDTMIQLIMDSKVVAQGVARNFNNGIVKVLLK